MKKQYTRAEVEEFIRKHDGKMTYAEMAEALGVAYGFIKWRSQVMGLHRPHGCIANNKRDEEYMDKVRREYS